MKKSFHTTGKTADRLEQANSAMGGMFLAVFALIIVIWLAHDTSAGLMTSLSKVHYTPYRDPSTLGLLLDWL